MKNPNNDYYVEIIEDKTEKVLERCGPHSEWKAEKIDRGITINLNHDDYSTRIVKG